MPHDHSRDSAAAAMSSAAWIPWPRSLALASLGRTSSRSGASLTAQVVELAGFLGRSGDPVVTIGSVGRSDSCLATGARLGRSNGQIDHVPERHPRLLVFILANIDQVVIAILNETELRRTPATGNKTAEYLPTRQFTELPWDYLHPNHAGYTAMGEAIDLSFFASHHH